MASDPGPNDYGCCEGVRAKTPAVIANRPGLSAIAYRVGTHSTFKQSLLASLSSAPAPMRDLTTRDDDDWTIALLDAWATAGDVLTFYQERIANESYLRTAQERLSVIEMARLIGYRPRPGVAAGTALAFTVDASPGSPEVASIPIGAKVQSVPGPDETPQTFETIEVTDARAEWNALKLRTTEPQVLSFGATTAWFGGVSLNLNVGDLVLFVGVDRETNPASTRWDMRRVTKVTPDAKNERTAVEWIEPLAALNPSGVPAKTAKVFALRKRASLFGYNAPDPKLFTATQVANYGSAIGKDGSGFVTDWVFTIDTGNSRVFLDALYSGVVKDGWLVLSRPALQQLYRANTVTEAALNQYALTAKSTRVELDTNASLSSYAGSNYRTTAVLAQSEELPLLAERPLATTATTGLSATLTLATKITNLPKGRTLIVEGQLAGSGLPMAEEVTVDACVAVGQFTKITLTKGLANNYLLSSVTVYANVANATHGETVSEVLGNGNGAAVYQQFALKQSPLTHVSDASAEGGAASTLQVRVNDVLWEEVPSLYQRGPSERIFVTRQTDPAAGATASSDQTDRTTVQFGDGINGARLPTGQLNVRATYRKGIGVAGNLKAGQLSILLSRPLGVTGAINPKAPAGGADAEVLDDARGNAPLTVLTLDRVVSLRDYEDFARAFAGVGKALATWTWNGQKQGVFVTVAGPGGAAIASDSPTLDNLITALHDKGDPFVWLNVKTYRSATFVLTATVKVDEHYLSDKVLSAVKQAVLDAFSFDQRQFGQRVALSEVVAVMQNVEGVLAVDVNALKRSDGVGGSGLIQPLPAALPSLGNGDVVLAAELLTVNAAGVSVTLM